MALLSELFTPAFANWLVFFASSALIVLVLIFDFLVRGSTILASVTRCILRNWFPFLVLYLGLLLLMTGLIGETFGLRHIFSGDPGLPGDGLSPISVGTLVRSSAFLSNFLLISLVGLFFVFHSILEEDEAQKVIVSAITLSSKQYSAMDPNIPKEIVMQLICPKHESFIVGAQEQVNESTTTENIERNADESPNYFDICFNTGFAVLILGYFPLALIYVTGMTDFPSGQIRIGLVGAMVAAALVGLFHGLVTSVDNFLHYIARYSSIHSGYTLIMSRLKIANILVIFALTLLNLGYDQELAGPNAINLMGWLFCLYMILVLFSYQYRPFIVVGIAICPLIIGAASSFRYQFPGIAAESGSYYAHPVVLEATARNEGQPPYGMVDPVEALSNWAARQPLQKPKVVIVAASGGGYRAAFWTALVLDRLKKESIATGSMPELTESIRLMTGASGGMVAAAYFVTAGLSKGATESTIVEQIQRDVAQANDGRTRDVTKIAVDSLSAISRQLVKGDIFHVFLPGSASRDRGIALEEQWSTLAATFSSLRGDERDGKRPSLVLTPVLVETGEPLYISNLDLAAASDANLTGLQFFKLFPGAQRTFAVQTAVRMNASFPYVSPAVDLPTQPKRRVVDAGFYDNYGINAAISYLRNERVMNWIKTNTSAVLLIQIRAYPVEATSVGSAEDKCADPIGEHASEMVTQGLGWLTTPFETLMSTRATGMGRRNQEQLEMLQAIYRSSGPGNGDFLHTLVFENRAKASMSWYLPVQELECMRAQLYAAPNQEAFKTLERLWKSAG